jgi:two-component system LytT family sensor kinase
LNDVAKAPIMVHKLSELMSYMLYDSNQLLVPLEKEVNYIKNYIALEQLRYDQGLEVTLSDFVGARDIRIAPLLMLPFVENSFKHGNKYLQGWIHVELSLSDDELIFKVENNKPDIIDGNRVSGIGLDNVSKRLAHQYPGQHDLQIFDTQDTYLVILRLSLLGKPIRHRIVEEVE